jgi:hypothetical protein
MKYFLLFVAAYLAVSLADLLTFMAARSQRRERPPAADWPEGDY